MFILQCFPHKRLENCTNDSSNCLTCKILSNIYINYFQLILVMVVGLKMEQIISLQHHSAEVLEVLDGTVLFISHK